jgi:hypothetical protein
MGLKLDSARSEGGNDVVTAGGKDREIEIVLEPISAKHDPYPRDRAQRNDFLRFCDGDRNHRPDGTCARSHARRDVMFRHASR